MSHLGIGPLWSVAPHCRVPFGSPVARLQLLWLAKRHPSYGALHLCYQDPSVHRPDFGSGEDLSPPGDLGLPIPVIPSCGGGPGSGGLSTPPYGYREGPDGPGR